MTLDDPEDLLHEAITRVLDGRRVWARGAPIRSFLAGVMQSIAWEWKPVPPGPLPDPPPPPDPRDRIYIAKIVAMFADDPVAQIIVLGMMEGARGEELQQSSGLGKVEYESKRKKIRRRIEKLRADEKSS
jgi:RNA polymerase sigma-70 factor (ECF subfamily)